MGRLYKEEKPMSVEIIINAIKGTNWSDADTKALSEFKVNYFQCSIGATK